MTLQEPQVLTFDVVGTLIDFEGGIVRFLRRQMPETRSIDDDSILAAYRTARARKPSLRFPDDLVRVYDLIAPQLDLPQRRPLAEGFRDSIRDWPPFPDSREALQRLKRRYKLVAMTNAQRWSFPYLSAALGDPFDDSVTVDEALCEKPDPCFFAFTRGRLSRDGHELNHILHVAQSQYHDIGVARAMGYTVCWIERRKGMKGFGGTHEVTELTRPDYHFGMLAELADAAEAGQLRMMEQPNGAESIGARP
jgi:putative hydrolase of the HAD superfamily